MVNDLTTLSGALVECKDQLISELANQGVTATYDPTTGLLGLISKISDIQPPSITLATNKSILSHYHSETATLTATHSHGAGKTIEIYNATTGVKIGDATDNQDGTYTYTYNSTGVGDISMTATSGTIESNSISIEDCRWYDPAVTSNNHSSDYGNFGNAPTLTVDTDGMKVSTTSGERWATIPILLTTDDDFELTYTYNGGYSTGNCAEISSASNQRHTLFYVGLGDNKWHYHINNGGMNTFYTGAISVGDKIKITRVNGVYTYYHNDTIRLQNLSNNSGGYVAFETYQDGRWTKYQDIKLKTI